MTPKRFEQECSVYTDYQCEDVIDTLSYKPTEIRHLVKETYRDGMIAGSKKLDELEKQIRDKLWLSTGQTVEEREWSVIGEIVARELGII